MSSFSITITRQLDITPTTFFWVYLPKRKLIRSNLITPQPFGEGIMNTIHLKTLALSATLVFSLTANADKYQKPDLGSFLEEFHQNPAQVMDQLPPKTEQLNKKQSKPFDEASLEGNKFVEGKDQTRKDICKLEDGKKLCVGDITGRAGFESNDLAENLVDSGKRHIRNLSEMDQKELQSAKLSVRPWSDDYWAIARGVLGYRYGEDSKNEGHDWKEHKDYVVANPTKEYLAAEDINFLSPSEKYDILVGDANFTLTNKMWTEGQGYYERSGKVETWMGICHGWAPAAYMLERPTGVADVIAADGKTELRFYPADIKGLASLLWAKARTYSRFVGGRCNTKDPKKDENGRILDQDCFDTNPGTWHKSVVNQIGVSDRSFIIDATYDYEVWNQPVYSYKARYFNVQTSKTSEKWQDAKVRVADYTKDKFKSYRDSKATYIVGVEIYFQYIAETSPSQSTTNSEDEDYVAGVTYRYDLEVDYRGNIIGGEWYSNAHPDFLWTPTPEGKARSRVDDYVKGQWRDGKALPFLWKRVAPYASREGLPLEKVIDGLIERSRAVKN